MIELRRHPIEITKERFADLLAMSYDEFYQNTNMHGYELGPYDYRYCIHKDNDNDDARLSYIDYLVNEKSFNL